MKKLKADISMRLSEDSIINLGFIPNGFYAVDEENDIVYCVNSVFQGGSGSDANNFLLSIFEIKNKTSKLIFSIRIGHVTAGNPSNLGIQCVYKYKNSLYIYYPYHGRPGVWFEYNLITNEIFLREVMALTEHNFNNIATYTLVNDYFVGVEGSGNSPTIWSIYIPTMTGEHLSPFSMSGARLPITYGNEAIFWRDGWPAAAISAFNPVTKQTRDIINYPDRTGNSWTRSMAIIDNILYLVNTFQATRFLEIFDLNTQNLELFEFTDETVSISRLVANNRYVVMRNNWDYFIFDTITKNITKETKIGKNLIYIKNNSFVFRENDGTSYSIDFGNKFIQLLGKDDIVISSSEISWLTKNNDKPTIDISPISPPIPNLPGVQIPNFNLQWMNGSAAWDQFNIFFADENRVIFGFRSDSSESRLGYTENGIDLIRATLPSEFGDWPSIRSTFIIKIGSRYFANANNEWNGIFRILWSDNGREWFSVGFNENVNSIVKRGSRYIIGTSNGIAYSTDGMTWLWSNIRENARVIQADGTDNVVFATIGNDLWRSTDGITWTFIQTISTFFNIAPIISAFKNFLIFSVHSNEPYISEDLGLSWRLANFNIPVNTLRPISNLCYAKSTVSSAWCSEDLKNWFNVHNSREDFNSDFNLNIQKAHFVFVANNDGRWTEENGNWIFVSWQELYFSQDGLTFKKCNIAEGNIGFGSIFVRDNLLFYLSGRVYCSNNGLDWVEISDRHFSNIIRFKDRYIFIGSTVQQTLVS